MESIFLNSTKASAIVKVTKDQEGFHFLDLNDNSQIWISNDDTRKLIEFLLGWESKND